MSALLIPLTFCLYFFLFYSKNKNLPKNTLEYFLKSFLITGLLIVVGTEILGSFRAIHYTGLCVFWFFSALVPLILLSRQKDIYHRILNNLFISFSGRQCKTTEYIFLILIGIYCAILLVTALMTPPSTWDALTTHMARVAHWAQNHTVENYPSWVLKQLNYPPGSAYILLHLFILAGNDILSNLAQWFAMIGCLAGTVLIARQLGADTRARFTTAIIALTIPMGLLQAVSTQNEQINSLWIISFVYFILKNIRTPKRRDTLFAGIAFALALTVKGTVMFFGLPFLLWLTFNSIKKYSLRGFQPFLIILLAILIINGPAFLRNIHLTQSVIAPSETSRMLVKNFNPASMAVNTLRNLAEHMVLPFKSWNVFIEKNIRRTDLWDMRKDIFELPQEPFREDVAGNFFHIILISASILITIIFLRNHTNFRITQAYGLCLLTGFFLFTIFVRWTPFNTRYHLPLFLLVSPWLAMILTGINRKITSGICIFLFILSAPWLFLNESRPWFGERSIFSIPRTKQYFANNPDFQFSYDGVAKKISAMHCQNIGLSFHGDSWEYPLWPILKKELDYPFRIEHVAFHNISSTVPFPLRNFNPCAIITDSPDSRETIKIGNEIFVKIVEFPVLSLFARQETLTPLQKTFQHFRKSIKPIESTKNNENTIIVNALFSALLERLEDAKQVDLDLLKERDNSLGNFFEQLYLKGLILLVNSIHSGNKEQFTEGGELLRQWTQWASNHSSQIRSVLLED